MLDFLTVNETSNDNQPTDDDTINGVKNLMEEAVNINNSWIFHAQSKEPVLKLSEQNPFIEAEG